TGHRRARLRERVPRQPAAARTHGHARSGRHDRGPERPHLARRRRRVRPLPERVPRGDRDRGMSQLPYLLAAWLFLAALYGVVTSRHFVHLVLCLAVTQSSTYVLLLAIGFRKGATAPVFKDVPVGNPA